MSAEDEEMALLKEAGENNAGALDPTLAKPTPPPDWEGQVVEPKPEPVRLETSVLYQIAPEYPLAAFQGCIMVSTKVFGDFGVEGYVLVPGATKNEDAHKSIVRVKAENLAWVGRPVWVLPE